MALCKDKYIIIINEKIVSDKLQYCGLEEEEKAPHNLIYLREPNERVCGSSVLLTCMANHYIHVLYHPYGNFCKKQ
jgi:hypothetical protein